VPNGVQRQIKTLSDIFAVNTESDIHFQRKMNGYQSLDFSWQLLSKYFPGALRLILGAMLQEDIWTKS